MLIANIRRGERALRSSLGGRLPVESVPGRSPPVGPPPLLRGPTSAGSDFFPSVTLVSDGLPLNHCGFKATAPNTPPTSRTTAPRAIHLTTPLLRRGPLYEPRRE